MKKKLLIFGLAAVMMLGTGSPSGLQAEAHGCTFTDKNHDGYCDKGDTHTHKGKHVDANHDGICDKGDGHCMKYRDKNKDGLCDYCNHKKSHKSHHNGNGNGNGNHHAGGHHH